jgi:hypothetical protein
LKLQKTYYPACVITVLIALSFGLLTICQVYLLKDNYPVSKLWIGSDYACVYLGTQHLIKEGTPYIKDFTAPPVEEAFAHKIFITRDREDSWYAYPPIPAYLNYPLLYFDLDTASRIMFFLLIAAIFSAYALINSAFQSIEERDRKIILLYGLIVIVLSYPFYFLIVRGHMIGITILLIAAGIYLLKKNNAICSVFFGLSSGMFLFPGLIVAPLLLFRRYKILFYTVIICIVLFLLCPSLWWVFFKKKLFLYTGETRDLLPENCSLSNTFHYFSIFFGKLMGLAGLPVQISFYNEAALAVYGLMFFSMAVADYKIRKIYGTLDANLEITLMVMYLPFMIAIPKTVFQYDLVILILLIPALCFLTQILKKPMPQPVFWLFSVGIALSQIQAHSLQNLFQPKCDVCHFFPAFGLFLVMIGCVAFKLWFWRVYSHEMQKGESFE